MIALALIGVALAGRPTDGGAYSFDDTDVIETYDGPAGLVRVTYSSSGDNEVRAGDDDEDGVPDFVEEVAATAEDVLEVYAATGFRPPISESEMGLDPATHGGSDAFDFYLVDFGGVGDGQFSTDKCRSGVCSGYMVMENDFHGYGYPSISEAIKVLTSHELFHAVQAAYNASEPSWMLEGTAVWGEQLYEPGTDDFLWFCDAYLDDVSRALDRPPAGAGSSYIYGTALFWAFLAEKYGDTSMVALQEAMVDRDEDSAVDAVEDVIIGEGDTLEDTWATFVRWNLATGDRAGGMDSYSFAADLSGVAAEGEGAAISDENRFYPLAATYYRIDHPGGELWFGTPDDPSGLVFSLHPVEGGGADGVVGDAVATLAPTAAGTEDLGAFDAGGYWLVGTYPTHADNSTRIQLCLGGEADMADCAPQDTGETGDTGATTDTGEEKPGGCGCATSGGGRGWWLALGVVGLARRRRGVPVIRA